MVIFKKNQSIQLSISIAALKLLRVLHKENWVHGDSHLGNFIYLCGRIYAIDFERSFQTSNAVQQLLDIQETFGHITGILIHTQIQNEWDMRDISGIHFHRSPLLSMIHAPIICFNPLCLYVRHPLLGGAEAAVAGPRKRYCIPSPIQRRLGGAHIRRKALFMLPVCTCFTCPKQTIRLQGCSLCRSAVNLQAATLFLEQGDEIIQVTPITHSPITYAYEIWCAGYGGLGPEEAAREPFANTLGLHAKVSVCSQHHLPLHPGRHCAFRSGRQAPRQGAGANQGVVLLHPEEAALHSVPQRQEHGCG